MDKIFYLAFYEDGKFSHYIGQPYPTHGDARFALADMWYELSRILPAKVVSAECFHFDRYGTPCMIQIEELEEGNG